jgi:hypothetical protein
MIATGIDPNLPGLPEAAFNPPASIHAVLGRNSFGKTAYAGPRALPGHGPHRYSFQLLALNGKLHFDKPPTLPEVLAQLTDRSSPAAVWMAFSNVSENMENSMSEQARRQASDPSGPTGQLATWLANFDLSAVPDTVRERARLLLLDGVGCALVGAQLPWSRTAVRSVMALEAEGPCSIIGWGRKATAPVAALLNGTFIQGSNSTTSIRWRRCIARH